MKGKRIIAMVALLVALCGANAYAQTFDEFKKNYQSEFNRYKSEQERQFKQFRDSLNADYADYMRREWAEATVNEAIPVPARPEPPRPVIKTPNPAPSNDRLPHSTIIPYRKPTAAPRPVVPLPEPETASKAPFSLKFYGADCGLPLTASHRFKLAGIKEKDVADGWMTLSADKYLPLVTACLSHRDRLKLSDWGYVLFTERLASAFFPPSQLNEARLMQMYLLVHSGYKARLARRGNRLVVLLPSEHTVYEYKYLVIDGEKFYLFDKSPASGPISVYNRKFPNEQAFSLLFNTLPNLPLKETEPRHFQSGHDKDVSVDVAVNRNLIDFFNDYPLSSAMEIYPMASLSAHAKNQLYPALKTSIAGKDRATAANMLLHFVQTALEYATDNEQFGIERPLFGDETLFYPYCDCEDRAILFSILVRELLGLDAVLLHYPGHLATGVCFETDVSGDYVSLDGKRYLVCDPTFIHADIGQSMPEFKQTAAEIIRIR